MRTKTLGAIAIVLLVCFVGALVAAERQARKPNKKKGPDVIVEDYPAKEIARLDFESDAKTWQTTGHQRLDDPKQAHAGHGCLFGEVKEVRKFVKVMLPVQLTVGRKYRISLWVRATNGTRLAVWQTLGKQRKSIGAQDDVPERWTRYAYDFTGMANGDGQIEIVGPSSIGGVIGKMWIDDVVLSMIDAPQELTIKLESRVEDFPALVASGDKLYGAWLFSENGVDAMRVAAWSASRPDAPRSTLNVPTPPGAWLTEPALAPSGDGAWLAFGAEVERQWDIYVCRVSAGSVSAPVPVTRDEAVDVRPALAVDGDGKLWVAWESNRDGYRAIYAASSSDGKTFSSPQRLSAADTNSYNPTACFAGAQGVLVAYNSFRDSNSAIWLRAFRNGKWQDERRLTNSPRIERHARLAARGDEAWVAWQSCTFDTAKYTMNNALDQRVHVARIDRDSLSSPLGMDDLKFKAWVSRPTVALDAQGRLWFAFRRSLGQHLGWEVPLYCYSGGAWSQRVMLSTHGGRMRAVPLAVAGERLVCAMQLDDLPQNWATVPGAGTWHSNVVFPAVDIAKNGLPPAPLKLAALKLQATANPTDPQEDLSAQKSIGQDFDLKAARAQRGEDAPRYTINYMDKKLAVFWGDFHDHSNVSVCGRRTNPPPEDLYDNLRDIARVDFFGATDHCFNFDPYIWGWNGKLARLNHDPERFVAFVAEEWTSSFVKNAERPDDPDALKRYGHRNFFFADPYFPRWFNARDGSNPRQIWDALKDANFVSMPHQLADTGNCPTDWKYSDETAQPVAEIFQNRGSYEYLGTPSQAARSVEQKGYFIQDAWAKGIVIGVIASPDHGGGRGKAAVYAESLTREAILDAVRARHTYGTTGAKIFLEVRVNGHLMGEKLPALKPGEAVTVEVKATGATELDNVAICRNNEFVDTHRGDGKALSFTYRDTAPPAGRLWYYARVIQKDGEIAWSSPVWLGAESTQVSQR